MLLRKHHRSKAPAASSGVSRRPKEKIRVSFRAIASTVASETRAIRRALGHAVRQAKAGGSLGSLRDLSSLLVSVAAAFRTAATRLEHEARIAMAEAAEVRKELPKLLEPTRRSVGGVDVLVFEFGQALTVSEAFAAALDLTPAETSVKKIGERRAFLPRRVADALVGGSDGQLVLLTRLRNRERRFVVRPKEKARLAPRGGALILHGGGYNRFYFPGTARMPAGTSIALPAAALTAALAA